MRVAAAIRQGRVCRGCNTKCVDKGTEAEPIEIECPVCKGEGCEHCNRGSVSIVGCPSEYCNDMANAVRLFELFDRGILPVSGGALDQSCWFLEAERFFRVDEAVMRSEADGN